jgi:hypothetical protein
MPREKLGHAQKKQFAGRIQQIISDRAPSNTAFGKKLDASGVGLSYSTVRKWVPEPSWWTWQPNAQRWRVTSAGRARSQKRRTLDWDAVQMPNAETLRRFCDFTTASADYILYGGKAPYYQQSRDKQELEIDLVVATLRGALGDLPEIPNERLADLWLLPSRLVDFLVETLKSEVILWNRYLSEMESVGKAITRIAIAAESMQESQPLAGVGLSNALKELLELSRRLVPETQLIRGARLVGPETMNEDANVLFGYYDDIPEGAVRLGGGTP